MIALTLTESEAARICYALAAEADVSNRKVHEERKNGNLSAASGRLELIHEAARDEALGVVRRIETLLN